MTRPAAREALAESLRAQAGFCGQMGSPLYEHLLTRAADDVLAGGPVWEVLAPHVGEGFADAVALRLMAAVHRLVLLGDAPRLASHYPSAGGTPGPPEDVWSAFRAVVAGNGERLRVLAGQPCQTNEVGRCAPLLWGWLDVVDRTGLPLRCLEVGSSAGLNLRWDHARYGTAEGATWGPPDARLDLRGLWAEEPAHLPQPLPGVRVAERRGCDVAPVDPTTDAGRLDVTASVWADMTERLDRLQAALEVAAAVPATVDRASLDTWTADRIATPAPAVATVVFHSVVAVYVPDETWRRFRAALAAAAAQATAFAPLAWLRLESVPGLRRHALTLTTWSGAADDGQPRVLATSGAHGQDVRAPTASQRRLVLDHLEEQGRHLRSRDDRGEDARPGQPQ